ncbi:PrgI family mobile element protein [Peribacillus loiseleuriae]|uniref:PrgI family mobile element protein n=1 Tax=Peribacillus loiseleuriae TaxID=1679170 RepID=UPI003D041813
MNEIVVPEDLTSEEKEILAIFSKRQFFIISPTLIFMIGFLVGGNIPFVHGIVDFGLRALLFIVAIIIAICLAFIRLDRREQYLSEYVVSKIQYLSSQKIYHS